jgi:hypothetical protein
MRNERDGRRPSVAGRYDWLIDSSFNTEGAFLDAGMHGFYAAYQASPVQITVGFVIDAS